MFFLSLILFIIGFFLFGSLLEIEKRKPFIIIYTIFLILYFIGMLGLVFERIYGK